MDTIIQKGSFHINRDTILRDLYTRCVRSDLTKVLLCRRILEIEGDNGWEVVMCHSLPLLKRRDDTIYPYGYEFVDAEYETVTPSHIPYLIGDSNNDREGGVYATTIEGIVSKIGVSYERDIRECVDKDHKFTSLSPSMNEWVNRSILNVYTVKIMTPLLSSSSLSSSPPLK
jgi:hypothetical protein